MPIQGLLQNIPQLDTSLANKGAPVMGGLQAAQQMQLTQAQAQHQQLQNHIANLQTTQQLLASVRYNPTQQNYDLQKQMAMNSGLGNLVQQFPADIRDAGPMIESAYWSTGQGLARAKTTAQILNDQILMGKNATDANKNNFQQGQNPAFPGATNAIGTGNTQIPELPQIPTWNTPTQNSQGAPQQQVGGGGMPTQPMMNASIPSPSGMGGQPLQPMNSLPSYTASPLGNSQLTGPAEMEKQKAQGKDWADFTSAYGDVNKNYLLMKSQLDQIDNLIGQGTNKFDSPLTGRITGLTQPGQRLNNLGSQLNLSYIASLTKEGGISRLDIPIVKAARSLSPSTSQFNSNTANEVDRLRLTNETGNAMSQLLPTLDQMGLRDKNKALDMLQGAIVKTKAINYSNGKFDTNKFSDWPNNLPPNIRDAYYTNNYINKGVPVFKKPDGNYFTGDKIQLMSQHYKVSPEAIVQKYNLKPALQSPYALNPQQQQQLSQLQQQNPQALGQ